jgi:hypothetical protein
MLLLVVVDQILARAHKVVLVDLVVEENQDMELTPQLQVDNLVLRILVLEEVEEHTLQLLDQVVLVVPVLFSSLTLHKTPSNPTKYSYLNR